MGVRDSNEGEGERGKKRRRGRGREGEGESALELVPKPVFKTASVVGNEKFVLISGK